jgi:hypothetical protein
MTNEIKNALDMKSLWRHKWAVFFFMVAIFSEGEITRVIWAGFAIFIIIDNKVTDIGKKLDCILEAQTNDK